MTLPPLFAAIPVALVQIRADATIGAVNDPARRLLGEAIEGRHYLTVLRQPALLERIEAALRSGQAGQARYRGRREAGREPVYQVQVSPLGPPEGGLILTFEDVTHLEEAREMRSDFVANVSHELRTPLTALSGFIETLQGPAADDAQARERFLEIMAREAARMDRLIRDLLSLSRVEAQARQRPTAPVDLCKILRETAATLGRVADERNVTITIHGCSDGADNPLMVAGDPDQLRQVFINLVENAIKYGREGAEVRLTLSTGRNMPSLRGACVAVTVEDEGEGISPRHLGRLTERFYRVDTHRSRDIGGTGLGLAIVKHIVNRHRGRLRMSSEQGKGSRFTVTLPCLAGD